MKLTSVTLAAVLIGSTAFAAEVGPKEVKYNDDTAIEMSLTGMAGDPTKGAVIMGTKSKGNCVACHEITALSNAPFQGNVGPILDGAGDRWSAGELRGLVVNAKMMFEGSVMPSFYQVDGFTRPGNAYTGKAGKEPLAPLLSAQEIEDVVAFLTTLKDE
ncbi:sulfur oxidation c-type cytochrome SoxX [Antarcticimicrobium sediminis]|uniref:Sulfur oxidation c-type cytochrome SoxX n=1 Tax=Antarcticimicrobium sediminis TaxID=2546227 RepID=A0A4R5ETJ2_9RHOB|nr:sulfur oxidation c-type cytochrome SoxX [Antarcticimicrobium sediminis]TDE38007.1 sulfur oxidation c-type cytochrome SoxX [Antarcticimicrobium sediminis]